MMEGEWNRLQLALKGSKAEIEKINEPFWDRLLPLKDGGNLGFSDIAIRYRDALLCAVAKEITTPFLHLDPNYFDATAFKKSGLVYNSLTQRVSLANAEFDETSLAIYQRKQRRFLVEEDVDLCLKAKLRDEHYHSYNGKGQSLAIRHALLSGLNSTILINLPTGSGKTLIIHSHVLFTPDYKLTLVIVPTVALAIEQGNKAQRMMQKAGLDHGGSYSLYGGMTETQKREVMDNIKAGQQRVLFTSPEMMATKLRIVLFDLAKSDRLASVIVDEAHIICQWGSEFRPEFQQISLFVHLLRKHSRQGVKVLLLSATFSPHTIDALKAMFEESSPVDLINASFLRPEPCYRVEYHKLPCSHFLAVKSALWSLPRPMIVYTSTQQDAQMWYGELKRDGFRKTGLFHGATNHNDRASLLTDWQNGRIDVMVATSAFGVGMDKSDVRSILHTSIPENIDRFYQESGRGGRDGAASLSLVICHQEQINLARKLNQEKLISVSIGFDRWQHMLKDSVKTQDGIIRIDLNSRRYRVQRDSGQNASWNLLTLLLMQRANLVKLSLPPPSLFIEFYSPTQTTQETEETSLKGFQSVVEVEILHDGHLTREVWDIIVENQRVKEKKARQESFSILINWILDAGKGNVSRPLCNILKEFYTYKGHQPEGACGGCPACLLTKRAPRTPTLGKSPKLINVSDERDYSFCSVTEVYYQTEEGRPLSLHSWKKWISILLRERQVQAIRANADVLSKLVKILPSTENLFWCSIQHGEDATEFDELILVTPEDPPLLRVDSNHNQILVAPSHFKDPENESREWWQSNANAKSLESFRREINYVDHQ